MSKITVTEGLAELGTIKKKIEKIEQAIMRYLLRPGNMLDPLEDEGGTKKYISEKTQAIRDLRTRYLSIRREIRLANDRETITIGDTAQSIADWLCWRRDLADGEQAFIGSTIATITQYRNHDQAKNIRFVTEPDGSEKDKIMIVAVNEAELQERAEGILETLGRLDGLLSLKNATITIDVG